MTEPSRAAVRVLFVDDDQAFLSVMSLELERLGFSVERASSGAAALALSSTAEFDVVLLDLHIKSENGLEIMRALRTQGSSASVIVLTGYGTIDSAIDAMRSGAAEYLTKPIKLEELEIKILHVLDAQRTKSENFGLKQYLASEGAVRPILTVDPRMLALMESVERVARSDVPVLIQGESGTGKELLARRLHQLSPQSEQPFLAVNCAVLRSELLESELFGHEKGAFTGALKRKLGLFEVASEGTIFLDEIGEIEDAIQAKLLRVLQSGEIRRMGSTANSFVTCRVIAATNRDLEDEVRAGRFRQDLFFRLNVVTLNAPPLRERSDDIPLLFEHFLAVYGGGRTRRLTPDATRLLRRYSWPGNVRELENVVRRTLIFHDHPAIGEDIVRAVLPRLDDQPNESRMSLAELEKRHILRVLAENDKKSAAAILGISLKTLYNKLHAYGEM